jgi:glycosyltransferase involved in cell wall biosynthesis
LKSPPKTLKILGTRGIPARHGGFETFAEELAKYLSKKGWKVTVYCQVAHGDDLDNSNFQGVELVKIYSPSIGPIGSIIFDLKVAFKACFGEGILLTLGYNTAVFNIINRVAGQVNIINMDGIEWRREKWSKFAKLWFWLNERIAVNVGNHLIADHPEIANHLYTRCSNKKITVIPYGSDFVHSADESLLHSMDLKANNFSVIIARPEPENSFLEMVRSFSKKKRNHKLVVLGDFRPELFEYHRSVIDVASNEVIFPGAIYDAPVVKALRFFSRFYLHGHKVGGTNPSLVEAMGAGCAIIAHDNIFNRWVTGDAAKYFDSEVHLDSLFDKLLVEDFSRKDMKYASAARFSKHFTWQNILKQYEELLLKWYPSK